MKSRAHLLTLVWLPFFWSGCLQVAYTVGGKQMAPEVQKQGQTGQGWYAYLPQRAPGFCLITRRAVVYKDPQMHLGCWRGLHPQAPHRVLMEARDTTLVLHRRYIWDGMTWGTTEMQDLQPTLLHDALYHALQGGAPFPRREADAAYARARRAASSPCAFGEYPAIRLFGGLFNRMGAKGSIIIEEVSPETPLAPLEPDRPEPLAGEAGA